MNNPNYVEEALQDAGYDRDCGNGFHRKPFYLSDQRKQATAMLCDPKRKLTRSERKHLMAARTFLLVPAEKVEPRKHAVRWALKLRTLTMFQLGRRLAQTARRAATAKYIIAKLTSFSPFRSRMQAVQDANLALFKQVDAEIDARLLACNGKLAEAK